MSSKKTRRRNKLRKRWKTVFYSALAITFLGIIWFFLLYVSQPSTENNSYQIQVKIETVEIFLDWHRDTDDLRIFAGDTYYLLDLGWRNEGKTTELANRLQATEEAVTITVWEHIPFPYSLGDPLLPLGLTKQITDIRSKDTVYWDVKDHNATQRIDRICMIPIGILFSFVVFVVCDTLLWKQWLVDMIIRREKRKLRLKNK